jgi:hypothetical protein
MKFLRRKSMQRTNGIYAILIATNIFMAGLVMEQGRIIETQKVLIKSLFFDTTQLAALRIKQAIEHH